MDERLLIEKIRNYNLLYDTNCLSYRDHNMRNKAWKEIGKEMKMSASLLKEAWTKLRNSYINALKRRRLKKNGQPAKKISPWKYEQQMSFLQPFLYKKNSQTNLEESSRDSLGFEENTSNVGNEDDEPEKYRPSDEESVFEPEVLLQFSSKRRHEFKESPADEMVQIKKTNAEYCKSKFEYNQTRYNEIDESDMFYLSMSQQAKRLPALDQAKIKLELCTLIQQAEIRQIESQAISYKRSNSCNSFGSS